MAAFPRLQHPGSKLVTIKGTEVSDERLDDGVGVGGPKERLIKRHLVSTSSGVRRPQVGILQGPTQARSKGRKARIASHFPAAWEGLIPTRTTG